jgi:1-acyl-sn-glycerol-3-phosphate acyltransferase
MPVPVFSGIRYNAPAMLRTTLTYLFLALYIAAAAPVGLLWAWLSGDGDFLYTLAHFCIKAAGWISGIRVDVRGKENILPGHSYLFLSNHQGNVDGPLLCVTSGRNLRAVIKKEIMRIPVLSLVLRTVNYVPVDRSDPAKARASIDRAARLLKDGLSFFAFPEGTRSRTGSLGEFKKGVFVMAIQAGVPIIPVTICNSRDIQPPGRYAIVPGTIQLIFHRPIPTEGLQWEDREQLLRRTRDAIAGGLGQRLA